MPTESLSAGPFFAPERTTMATISLGKAPANFKKIVKVLMLDGTQGTIECVFKYRTSVEYGALVDEMNAKAAGDPEPAPDAPTSVEGQLKRKREKNGEYLLQIVEGWNLDVSFSLAAAIQLCDELPGAGDAIFETYRAAIVEGRLGN